MLTRREFVKGILATLCVAAIRGGHASAKTGSERMGSRQEASEPTREERAIIVKDFGVAIWRRSHMMLDHLGIAVDSETVDALWDYWGYRCLTCRHWQPTGEIKGGHDCGWCPKVEFVTGSQDSCVAHPFWQNGLGDDSA